MVYVRYIYMVYICVSFCGFRFNAIIINYAIEWNEHRAMKLSVVFMGRSAASMHRNEWIFGFGKRAPFLWFFDIWKLSELDRDRDRDRGRPLCRHILLSILTFVSISFHFSVRLVWVVNFDGVCRVSVRLNYCLYFAFKYKCKYK